MMKKQKINTQGTENSKVFNGGTFTRKENYHKP
jgi:hypothetical protein